MVDPFESPSRDDVYFAAKSAQETASNLISKGQSFFNVLQANAYLEKINKMWRALN